MRAFDICNTCYELFFEIISIPLVIKELIATLEWFFRA
jgi:hypothetical protein